jgi:peptide/nickel transport system substrate-binding protein
LFTTKSNEYRNDNPDLPTLEPWQLSTKPPSSRFIFVRNPYFHRVDTSGRQLPYIDRIALTIASAGLLPAKTAAGESDLQARGLGFENYTVLKQAEKRNGYRVLLWKTARGSELALLPNLTCSDPAWRALFRNTDFRRALSLAVHRKEINKVIYYGLAREGNDTVLPASPMFEPEFETLYAAYDLDEANRLLDKTGLVARGTDGIRRLTDGRPLEIIVETAGEDPNQVAILQLIRDSWQKIGVKLFIKPEQRDVLRNRIFAGTTLMSVWTGLENALPTRKTSPQELAPTTQQQLYWSKWGQYIESGGHAGEAVDLAPAQELAQLNQAWATTIDTARQEEIWRRMLRIRAEQAFTIGTVRGVPQPVVVNTRLRNVPEQGVFNWEPGAQFGLYHPDSFWFDDGGDNTVR